MNYPGQSELQLRRDGQGLAQAFDGIPLAMGEIDNRMLMLSIVIPTCNDAKTIAGTLENYVQYFSTEFHEDFEIIVVLNGCTDGTSAIVKGYMTRFVQIRLKEFGEKLGKGGALIEGFKVARGQTIAFADADGATSPQEIHRLMGELGEYDGAIDSRWLPGSNVLVRQPLIRRTASRGFNLIVRLLLGLRFNDTQCGAKVFRKWAVDAVVPCLEVTNFAFDVELLYRLGKGGYRVKEVPATWSDCEGSTLRIGRAVPIMFLAVVRLRLLDSPLGWFARRSVWGHVYRRLERTLR